MFDILQLNNSDMESDGDDSFVGPTASSTTANAQHVPKGPQHNGMEEALGAEGFDTGLSGVLSSQYDTDSKKQAESIREEWMLTPGENKPAGGLFLRPFE